MHAPSVPTHRRRSAKLSILGTSAAALLLIAGCSGGSSGEGSSDAPSTETAESQASTSTAPSPAETLAGKTLELRATSNTAGQVTWGNAGSQNSEPIQGDWSTTIEDIASDDFYNVTVTGDFMTPESEVTCTLLINGEVVEEASGSGQSGVATCTQPWG